MKNITVRNPVVDRFDLFRMDRPLTLTLESQDGFVIEMMVLPAPANRDAKSTHVHPALFPISGAAEDDLANATWEDAEWR